MYPHIISVHTNISVPHSSNTVFSACTSDIICERSTFVSTTAITFDQNFIFEREISSFKTIPNLYAKKDGTKNRARNKNKIVNYTCPCLAFFSLSKM